MLTKSKSFITAAILGTTFAATAVQAAPIPFTYTYHPDTIFYVPMAGQEKHSNYVELNDGYVPTSDTPWDEDGGIWRDETNSYPKPGVIIDLGDVYDLESITIYYMVRQGSGVYAPDTLDITIDDVALPQITDFDHSNWEAGNAVRSVTIDLTGYSGQSIYLDFRNTGQWLGLAEIVVNAVPEPASFALIALGGLLMLKRRH